MDGGQESDELQKPAGIAVLGFVHFILGLLILGLSGAFLIESTNYDREESEYVFFLFLTIFFIPIGIAFWVVADGLSKLRPWARIAAWILTGLTFLLGVFFILLDWWSRLILIILAVIIIVALLNPKVVEAFGSQPDEGN